MKKKKKYLVSNFFFHRKSCYACVALFCYFTIIYFHFQVLMVSSRWCRKTATRPSHATCMSTITQPRDHRQHNKLHKVWPLLNCTDLSFPRRYKPGRELSIDEAMVAFKGRCYLKQYLPSKPTKWGFKVWVIAEPQTGYVCGYNIYTGKRAQPSPNGLGYDVVVSLAERYLWQCRHLYFDNYFSSIPLLRHLELVQTYACATVRANPRGLPAEIKNPGRLQRGESVKRQCGNVVATVWHDKRDVRMISTNIDP